MDPIPAVLTELSPLNESSLRTFLHAFYAKARQDDSLGPVFGAAIPDERWPAHLDAIYQFWSSVLFGTRQYRGNPFGAHLGKGIEPDHFSRWLGLFHVTARQYLEPAAVDQIMEKARRIAESLQMGMFYSPRQARESALEH